MARRVSRRVFLTTTVTVLSTTACSELTSPPRPKPLVVASPMPRPVASGVADSYVVVAPRMLRAGQTETVSLALLRDDQPISDKVTVALLRNGQMVAQQTGTIAGRGSLALQLPDLDPGAYQLQVSGAQFRDQAELRVEDGTIVFVETDKPIYKPGQTVHIRILALDPSLRPAAGEAIVEVLDAKGIKIFKRDVMIDAWGMAEVDLPLSSEPNLGVWKVQASVGQRTSQVDVRVERYVLPKYGVEVELASSWALANETIRGTVMAEYSFGKPVSGEVEIIAARYVGTWEEYARVTQPIDGRHAFELPPVGYAAGSPESDGLARVRLDVTVREQATGYIGSTSQLVTIASSPVGLTLIPENAIFKPELPFGLLVVAETPDQQPVDTAVQLNLSYRGANYNVLNEESHKVTTVNGLATLQLSPPRDAVSLMINASATNATSVSRTVQAGYSPSGSFIHITQTSQGPLEVGDTARFSVAATGPVTTLYYEVLARGMVVLSDMAATSEIAVPLTPALTPEARLLVYQILGTGEVAADYLPFTVTGTYPHAVAVQFGAEEVRPGAELEIQVQTEGEARVGLVAVDRAVFTLAENRLNLQQVFDELERLYMQPQAELHMSEGFGAPDFGMSPGAQELFQQAGVVVLTNRNVPEGKQQMVPVPGAAEMLQAQDRGAVPPGVAVAPQAFAAAAQPQSGGLAEVQRVRQFFPETWVWASLTTDASGRAVQRVTAPDSITTWMLRAVALSKEHGLGIAEAQLRVFQPFFVQVDLPFSALRGEEFPAMIALYNYQTSAEQFTVELAEGDWFDLLETATKTVTVQPNSVGAVEFMIRPTGLGVRTLSVTARSRSSADAIMKELLVEPEGVQREIVTNAVLSVSVPRTFERAVPPEAVAGSPRTVVALTGNVLSQTIEGLEGLLQMPFGCGEQNMLLFAPDVFIVRYLDATGQRKPELFAKAEKMMLTGYQRQLTYLRDDGSFSAFGQTDPEGSLWLTAFVLKTFAQARGLIFIDDTVLSVAQTWIGAQQRSDGAFTPVGFVHHQELLGGLSGTTALTAYVAVALHEAGDAAGAARAVRYLEAQLDQTDDAYALALSAYALALAKSGRAQTAIDKLLAQAQASDEGLSWGDAPGDQPTSQGASFDMLPGIDQSAAIETTGYAVLALLQHGDLLSASSGVRWLASRRNAYGGFGSTQDTVVALQAMTSAASVNRAAIDATVTLQAGSWRKDVPITAENADVLQMIEVPGTEPVTMETRGSGQIVAQLVQRFNLPAAASSERSAFQIDVRYDADQIAVDDLLTITATISFTPPPSPRASAQPATGMVVLDIAVPTGFAPVTESIDSLLATQPRLKRWDLAGRKVICYIEELRPNESLTLVFDARALYPVRAQAVASRAYAYYRPEWSGEHLGRPVVVDAV